MSAPSLSVHDPDFKHLVTIPLSAVRHLPPAHLEISRLVLCRKFDAQDPSSCPMGDQCKFVHADLHSNGVVSQSIHVNYAWRSLEDVTFPHLPAGEMVPVMAPNNRAPAQLIPSELLIATKGALCRHEQRGPLSHCAHFFFNRMCNRGDRCNFVHALYIDPAATDFQRAPPRAGGGYVNGARAVAGSAVQPTQQQAPAAFVTHARLPVQKFASGEFLHSDSSCDVSSCSESGSECDANETHYSSPATAPAAVPSLSAPVVFHYRRNPYSLLQVTVQC